MNDTCYFTLDMKKLDLCSLLIYTPSSGAHRPRRNRCVFSCKMRLAFISTVNLREKICKHSFWEVYICTKICVYMCIYIPM